MEKSKVLEEVKNNFNNDLKKKICPLYDISQEVHENTVNDLKELFEAVANFSYDEANKYKQIKHEAKMYCIANDLKIGSEKRALIFGFVEWMKIKD